MAKKRFITRKVKTCWRNSMIAGNPITRTFEKYAVEDREWMNDRFSGLSFHESFVNRNTNTRKFRRLCDSKEEAEKIAEQMNTLCLSLGNPKAINFSKYGDKIEIIAMER